MRLLSLILAGASFVSSTQPMKIMPQADIHSWQAASIESPVRRWRVLVKPDSANDSAVMWLQRVRGLTRTRIGELQRDAEIDWCPDDECLLVLERPSIENSFIRWYVLSREGSINRIEVDQSIRTRMQRAIGSKSKVLFYNLAVLGLNSRGEVLVVAQQRYVRAPALRPAFLYTSGFLLDSKTGKISGEITARSLKTRYGFDKEIA